MEVKNNDISFVSIITPVYNAEKYIAETITGVINQTYKNWEMIIVDDCSTDNSRDIVSEYAKKDERIKLIKSEINFGGPARPRNIGLENAKGQYVAFLDADDVWLPKKLEVQIYFIQKEQIDIVHTLANTIDENSNVMGAFNNRKIYSKLKYFMSKKNILFYTNYININSVLMKKVDEMRFEEDKNLIALEDWRFWIKAQESMSIALLEEVLLHYRVHSSSISNRSSDVGYRKTIYMLAKLFLKKEVSLRHYLFSHIFHVLKILGKNV